MLDSVRDESGKDAAVRLVFEPRTSKIDRDEFANMLLAQTALETSVPINLVMIGRDGRPRQKALPDILLEWIDFRVETVRRRSQHRLSKVHDRIHILEGRQQVLLNIDKVIKLIRNADEPKAELMNAFKLTERQAEDILELRLRQLARLEGIRIEQELAELRKDETSLQKLLGSEPALRKQVGKEFDEDAKKFGDDRRTLLEAAERAAVEAKVIDEPVTVVISEKGFVRARQGHGHDATQMSFRAGDTLYGAYECRTVDHLLALGANGRVYTVSVAQLPSARGDGAPVTSMIELDAGTRLVAYVAGAASQRLLLSTSAGFGFACAIENMLSRQKGGKQFIAVEQGAVPLRPAFIDPADDRIVCLSERGRLLSFPVREIKQQPGGGRGVTLMGLDEGEKMLAAISCGKLGVAVAGLKGTTGKPTEITLAGKDLQAHDAGRARKGTLVQPRLREPSLRKVLPPRVEG